jgi:hypothetical protein
MTIQKSRLLAVVLVLSTMGCGEYSDAQLNLKQTLPGMWITSRIEVTINSLNGTDTTIVEKVEENTWRNRFFVHPPEYYFGSDNKYRRVHRSLADTLISNARGLWNTFGDTLMLIEPDATYQYVVSKENEQIIFKTMVDWDGDGQTDDEFSSWQRLLRKMK